MPSPSFEPGGTPKRPPNRRRMLRRHCAASKPAKDAQLGRERSFCNHWSFRMQKALLIFAATTFVVGPAMVLPAVPIFAEDQTSVDQTAAADSVDVMELMSKAKDLPLHQVEDPI